METNEDEVDNVEKDDDKRESESVFQEDLKNKKTPIRKQMKQKTD